MRDCVVGVSTIVLLAMSGCWSEAPSGRGTFPPGYWVSPLETKTFDGWKVLSEGEFSSASEAHFVEDSLILEAGDPMTGIAITAEDFPRENYEVKLEAKRIDGEDFFCGMTFAVGQAHCTLVVGGWGGQVVGLSNVDDFAANENMTRTDRAFDPDRWYALRLRVTFLREFQKVEAWIDGEQVVDLDRFDRDRVARSFSIWPEQAPARPFGIATYLTKAAIRNLQVRRLIEL